MSDITIGTRVRSFDFAETVGDQEYGRDLQGERACYIEGTVEAIDTENFDCPRYKIRIEHRVFAGRVGLIPGEVVAYPPVNGTPKLFGGVTNSVEVIS